VNEEESGPYCWAPTSESRSLPRMKGGTPLFRHLLILLCPLVVGGLYLLKPTYI
jgi:hypothetical protein